LFVEKLSKQALWFAVHGRMKHYRRRALQVSRFFCTYHVLNPCAFNCRIGMLYNFGSYKHNILIRHRAITSQM